MDTGADGAGWEVVWSERTVGTSVKKYMRYAVYLARHKWYVFLAAWRLGVPWRGLTHDLSKFLPSEFFSYADYFYGGNHLSYDEWSGYAKQNHPAVVARWCKEEVQRRFDKAWLLHQKRNDHHWQWCVLHEDSGATKVLPMSDAQRRELLADWRGAGKAITGKDNTTEWFTKNRQHMLLHPDTAQWLWKQLGMPVPWRDDIGVPRPDGKGVQFTPVPEARS